MNVRDKETNGWKKQKPQAGCQHQWVFVGLSKLTACTKCRGWVMPGDWQWPAAYQEASMTSGRGSSPKTDRDAKWYEANPHAD